MLRGVLSLKNIIWICAIGLATFSGYYSVYGISKLFAGGSFSIIGMAAMLELAKLVVVAFLHNYHSTLSRAYKVYLTVSVIVLMGITSIGVYGYLTNAYQTTASTVNVAQNELTMLETKRQMFESQRNQIEQSITQKTDRVSQYDKIRIGQENSYSKLLEGKRGTRGLQQNIKGIDQTTSQLNSEISSLSAKSTALSDSITAIEQRKFEVTSSTFSSELGPLLFLSRITGQPMDQIVNWFILFLVVVFDPLAVSLVIAANHISKVGKVSTGPAISGLNDDFPEGSNDHTSIPSEPLSELPDEWIEESNEIIEEEVVAPIEKIEDEEINDLEIKKEITILDPDQEDLDPVDQKDQEDLEDLDQKDPDDLVSNLETVNDVTVLEPEDPSSAVTFEQQQTFYNGKAHSVNRASGGL